MPWKEEVNKVLEENHEGACGHFAFKTLCKRFYKKGMRGLACRRMFLIDVLLVAKDANHLEREF